MSFAPHHHIQVALDYRQDPERVLFTYECFNNHHAYLCLSYIWDWLNTTTFTVESFQVNQCVIRIPNDEVRVMLKLMFAPADRRYTDDPMF